MTPIRYPSAPSTVACAPLRTPLFYKPSIPERSDMTINKNLTDAIQVQECSSIRFAMQAIIELHKSECTIAEAMILKTHIEALANIMQLCHFILDENCQPENLPKKPNGSRQE